MFHTFIRFDWILDTLFRRCEILFISFHALFIQSPYSRNCLKYLRHYTHPQRFIDMNLDVVGTSGSPFRSRGTSYTTSCSANMSTSSQHLSRSHSPMATISRCQSPTNPIFMSVTPTVSGIGNGSSSRSHHQTLLALSGGQSALLGNGGYCNRPPNQYLSYSSIGTAMPELCLEHVWTESAGMIK